MITPWEKRIYYFESHSGKKFSIEWEPNCIYSVKKYMVKINCFRWRRYAVIFSFNLAQHWGTRLAQIETNAITGFVPQSIHLQKKQTRVFSLMLFISIWKTLCTQIPAYLVPNVLLKGFDFCPVFTNRWKLEVMKGLSISSYGIGEVINYFASPLTGSAVYIGLTIIL